MSNDSGRPRSRRGEGEALRAEVLGAVDRLLAEWGSDEKLTMRAVAKEVGVAAPSIYLHFVDKAELVWAALSGKYEQLAEQMRSAELSAAQEGPRERLREQVHAYCRFAMENPGHYRLMYEVRQPRAEPEKLGLHPGRVVSRRFRNALAACADGGYPVTLPLRQAAHTLWTGLHGMVSVQHSLGQTNPAESLFGLADGLIDILVGAQRVEGPVYPAETAIERLFAQMVVDEM